MARVATITVAMTIAGIGEKPRRTQVERNEEVGT
jgi:hypothetical protein